MSKTIKFKSVSTSKKFSTVAGKCHGHILHNGVLDIDKMSEAFAKLAKIGIYEARMHVSLFVDYVVSELGEGKLLNFGDFEIFLAMSGGIEGLNGRFDPEKNAITANLRMHKGLKKALALLEPVNVTCEDSHVTVTSIIDGRYKTEGVICASEVGYLAGGTFLVNTEMEDEGVWLEDSEGERVARARVLQSTSTTLDFKFDDPPPPGDYRLAVHTRMGEPSLPAPAHVRRKVTIRD